MKKIIALTTAFIASLSFNSHASAETSSKGTISWYLQTVSDSQALATSILPPTTSNVSLPDTVAPQWKCIVSNVVSVSDPAGEGRSLICQKLLQGRDAPRTDTVAFKAKVACRRDGQESNATSAFITLMVVEIKDGKYQEKNVQITLICAS